MSNNKIINKSANKNAFKFSLVALAVIGLSAPALAEETKEEKEKENEVEVIEVTGQRSNLISAQNMKMDADTVMDALSSADMGSMPDRSVLEAVSRLPGVAIERFAAAEDPDHFGVEGGGVVVRGLTHVRSEFNGRDSFSATSDRGLSFEDVSPELMGSVAVYKNQTADMIEGGIAGTIVLNTRKPFDQDKRVISLSLDTTYTDIREENSPSFSALYSDTWDTDSGRWGFLVNASKSTLKVESRGTQVGLYRPQNRDMTKFVPESARITDKQDDSNRAGFASSLQWESTDKTVLVTAEYIRSEADVTWHENAIDFNDSTGGNLLPIAGTEFEYDENGFFESGIMTSFAGWRSDRAPQRIGALQTAVSRMHIEDSTVNDYSLNVKYTPNDTWAFNFDIQNVVADLQSLDLSAHNAVHLVTELDLNNGGMPSITYHPGDYDGQADYVSSASINDPSGTYWRSAMDFTEDNEGDLFATRFDAEYTLDEGILTTVTVGARYSERDQTTQQSRYNWAMIAEGWVTGGDVNYISETDTSIAPVTEYAFGDRSNVNMESGLLFPSRDLISNYDTFLGRMVDSGARIDHNISWSPVTANGYLPGEVNETRENKTAVYMKLDFDGEIGDMMFSANAGLRYIKIENETDGFLSFPNLNNASDNLINSLSENERNFSNGASYAVVGESEYTNVLPSVNFKLDLTDEVILRFGFSEAISLPSLGNLRNHVTIGKDQNSLVQTFDPDEDVPEGEEPTPVTSTYTRYQAVSGNPNLQPMESYNYDLGLEWYFAEAGSLSFALFHKDLTNYFITTVNTYDVENDGATMPVTVRQGVNGDDGKIQGYEISYQQFYDELPGAWSGLGLQLNYTRINEKGSPQSGLRDQGNIGNAAQIAFDNMPLQGLSEQNANAAVLYEKYGFSGRIAYNWRSDYLLTTRDNITQLPIYVEGEGHLDASLFWSIDDNWKVGIQGTNLTNTITKTKMQINQEGDTKGRSWFEKDRRYSFVVRATF